jgi:hypothetical protein
LHHSGRGVDGENSHDGVVRDRRVGVETDADASGGWPSRGKRAETRLCWLCGTSGHAASACPVPIDGSYHRDPTTTRPPHWPVLPTEVQQALNPEPGKIYLDGTFGAGGHTRGILSVEGACVRWRRSRRRRWHRRVGLPSSTASVESSAGSSVQNAVCNRLLPHRSAPVTWWLWLVTWWLWLGHVVAVAGHVVAVTGHVVAVTACPTVHLAQSDVQSYIERQLIQPWQAPKTSGTTVIACDCDPLAIGIAEEFATATTGRVLPVQGRLADLGASQ